MNKNPIKCDIYGKFIPYSELEEALEKYKIKGWREQ